MNKILQNLEEYIKKHPNRSFFASGVLLETIQVVESRLKINLPDSYKIFLQKYNGGYIASQASDNLFLPEWESNSILSLEEMATIFQEKEDICWKLDSDYQGLYPFIPICRLPNNEILITVNRDEAETPIFDAWHEAFSFEWGMLSETFKDFLNDYINKEGRIQTISEDNDNCAKKYIPDYNSTRYYQAEKHFNKGLDLLCELKYSSSIKELSQALQLDPAEAQYHFFLSSAYAGSNDNISALFAIEQALKIKPEEGTYLFQKADILGKMKYYDKFRDTLNQINSSAFKDTEYFLSMGRVMISAEDDTKALEFLQQGLQVDNNNVDLLNEIAYLYCRKKQYKQSEEILNRILHLEEDNALAYYTLFDIYHKQNNKEGLERINPKMEELLYTYF